MDAADYYSAWKSKKNSMGSSLKNSYSNHPNRLTALSTSGAIAYTIDGRLFTSPGTAASVYQFDVDYSLANPWTRLFQTRIPWNSGLPTALSDGEFSLSHRPVMMWAFETQYGADPASVVGGSVTKTDYTRLTITDPWVAGSPVTTDLDLLLSFTLGGGGDPVSGGYDTDPAARALITFFNAISGTHSSKFPNMGANIYRFPWDTWASETAEFSSIFAAHLSAKNTADGGGHSGTCSLSLDFA
jgi:hypothetical protein